MLPRVPLVHLIQVLELEFEPRSDSKACALAQCVYNDFEAKNDHLKFCLRDSLVAQVVKHLPAMWRPRFNPWIGRIPCRRKWQSTPALTWKIPWTEEPGRLQSMGLQSRTRVLLR